MDIIMLGIFVTWVVLVIVWIAYVVTTKKIINQQEHEITTLKASMLDLLSNMDKTYDRGYADGMMDTIHDKGGME